MTGALHNGVTVIVNCALAAAAARIARIVETGFDVPLATLLPTLPPDAMEGHEPFGLLVQYPAASGRIHDHQALFDEAHRRGMERASLVNRINYETRWLSRPDLVRVGFDLFEDELADFAFIA